MTILTQLFSSTELLKMKERASSVQNDRQKRIASRKKEVLKNL